jgi:hypothetical protein
MEFFAVPQTKYRFLICSDVDGLSATKLTENFVYSNPEFDAIILSGPFSHKEATTPEEIAVMGGDIASIIAQFENLVCRVIYLPSEYDPVSIRNEQLHLTPNSLNIHGRQVYLAQSLRILGFSEKNEELSSARVPSSVDRSSESDDELENVGVAAGQSASIIKEMLQNSTGTETNANDEADSGATLKLPSSSSADSTGIFVLNYRYSHTLNQLLFHMGAELDQAKIALCVISSADCPETSRLPVKFGKLHIAAPKSLRQGGNYVVVDIEQDERTLLWDKITVDARTLP